MLKRLERCGAPLLVGFFFGTLLFLIKERFVSVSDLSSVNGPYVSFNSSSFVIIESLDGNKSRPSLQQFRILIIVLSSARNFDQRDIVRRTWLELYKQHPSPEVTVTVCFVVGMKKVSSKIQRRIVTEQDEYQDMLLLDGFEESYNQLSLKILQIFFIVHEEKYDYLVKVDDDTYLQVDLLIKALKKMGYPEKLYWGYMSGNEVPLKGGKWRELAWFLCPHYMSFGLGAGYVLSWNLVKQIGQFADRLKLYHNEDVTVGSWLIPYEMQRVHDVRFAASHHGHCSSRYIVSHKETMQSSLAKKQSVLNTGRVCGDDDDVISRIGHEYNWKAPPDHCCIGKNNIPIPLT